MGQGRRGDVGSGDSCGARDPPVDCVPYVIEPEQTITSGIDIDDNDVNTLPTSDSAQYVNEKSTLSFISYNVDGLCTIMNEIDLSNFIRGFSFAVFVETFVVSVNENIFPDHVCFVSPALKLSDSVHGRLSGGVIVCVKKELRNYVEQVPVEYDNTVVLKLSKKLLGTDKDAIFIATYVPPVDSPYYKETDIVSGISVLEDCMLDVTKQVGELPFILCGDLNARTGCKNVKYSKSDSEIFYDDLYKSDVSKDKEECTDFARTSMDSNVNMFGNHFLSLCENFDMFIVNGTNADFSCEFTYISSTGCSVVDYFAMSSCLSKHCVGLSVLHRTESKHMPITFSFLCNSICTKSSCSAYSYKYERYRWSEDKSHEFIVNARSDFAQTCFNEALHLLDEDINLALDKFNEGIIYAGECMKKVIYIGNEKQQRWFDVECKMEKKLLRQCLRKFLKHKSVEDRKNYVTKRKEYKCLLKRKKADHKRKLLDSLYRHKQDPKLFWNIIRSVRGKSPSINSISKVEWFSHFEEVFNCNYEDENPDSSVNDSHSISSHPTLDQAISVEEVEAAARSLKNDKAAGPDRLIGEFFKFGINEIVPFLTKFFNTLFDYGLYPDSWTEAIIQPLHKKGDTTNPNNYRGISLLNLCSKMYSFILNKRITKWVEENNVVGEEQAGFRKKHSTIDHIFTLTALVQKQLSRSRKLYCAFIDFKKAFDSISRDKLWNILKSSGIDGKMLRALKSMYKVVKAKVRVGSEMTDSFSCPKGLKQGEISSPVLFSLFINELTKEMTSGGKHGIQLSPDLTELLILLFADDVVLVSDTVVGLQNQLNLLCQVSKRLDLVINLDKSDIVIFRKGGFLSTHEKWFFDDKRMNVVNIYKYLGVLLSTRLSFTSALEDNAVRAKKAVILLLKTLWRLDDHSPGIFLKLFDCQVLPILSYGSEIWALIGNLDIIEKVHLFALKRFLGVSVRTPKYLVYGETGRYPLFINMYIRCVKYWLKLITKDVHCYPRKAYNMLFNLHLNNSRNWVSEICYVLYKYGFGTVWENQGVGDISSFISEFKNRLIDSYTVEWKEKLSTREYFTFYSSIKHSLTLSHYLLHVNHVQARSALARFRMGMSELRSRSLRYNSPLPNTPVNCPSCTDVIENEVHFLLVCPLYSDIRHQYIPEKFTRRPSLAKLSILLASVNQNLCANVALFIYHAFKARSLFIATACN